MHISHKNNTRNVLLEESDGDGRGRRGHTCLLQVPRDGASRDRIRRNVLRIRRQHCKDGSVLLVNSRGGVRLSHTHVSSRTRWRAPCPRPRLLSPSCVSTPRALDARVATCLCCLPAPRRGVALFGPSCTNKWLNFRPSDRVSATFLARFTASC